MKNTKKLMKTVLLFTIIALSACEHIQYPDSLIVADSLSYVKPDSALNLLLSIKKEMEQSNEATRMYYRLLCIKARDKAFMIHETGTDREIADILNYYIDKGDRQILPEAYYYAGRVTSDFGDAPQALKYYEKALSILEKRSEEKKEFILKGKVHSQIAELLSYQELYDDALENLRVAYKHDVALKDTSGIIYDLCGMADIYRCTNYLDKSIKLLETANKIATSKDNADETLTALIQSQLADLYHSVGRQEEAKQLAFPAITHHYDVYAGAAYIILAEIYLDANNIDSATICYKKILDVGNVYSKQTAYYELANMAIAEHHPDLATKYLEQYMVCHDSANKIKQQETVKKIHSVYNYKLREKENIRLNAENRQKSDTVLILVLILAVSIMTIFAYYFYSKNRSMKQELRIKKLKQIQELAQRREKDFIAECKEEIKILEERLADAHEENHTLETELKIQKMQVEHRMYAAKEECEYKQKIEETFFSSTFYVELFFKIDAGNKLTDEVWQEIYKKIDFHFPLFIENLKRMYSKITDVELQVCILNKAQILQQEHSYSHCTPNKFHQFHKKPIV